jgi:branched-chain amino acid transport system permease protein
MVYGVLQLINFAHSEVFMVGVFGGLYTLKAFSTGPEGGLVLVGLMAAAIVAGMASSGLMAVVLERVAYRPLRRRGAPRLSFLITAIGASLFLQNLFFVWGSVGGPAPRPFPNVMTKSTAFTTFGYPVSNQQILIVATVVVMYLILDRFVMRSHTGRGIRAVAEDPEIAGMMGVNIDRIVVVTFLVGGIMAGAAGVLYGVYFNQARFDIGFIPGIKAFTAAVLGGIGNIRGALLGGILLGLFESAGVTCLRSAWEDVIAFLILVAVLMFRPSGLLGEAVRG